MQNNSGRNSERYSSSNGQFTKTFRLNLIVGMLTAYPSEGVDQIGSCPFRESFHPSDGYRCPCRLLWRPALQTLLHLPDFQTCESLVRRRIGARSTHPLD